MFSWIFGGEPEPPKIAPPARPAKPLAAPSAAPETTPPKLPSAPPTSNSAPPAPKNSVNLWQSSTPLPPDGEYVSEKMGAVLHVSEDTGLPELRCSEGKVLAISPIPHGLPRPALFDPMWIARCDDKVMWLEPEGNATIRVLEQTTCNGSPHGERYSMLCAKRLVEAMDAVFEKHGGAMEDLKSLKDKVLNALTIPEEEEVMRSVYALLKVPFEWKGRDLSKPAWKTSAVMLSPPPPSCLLPGLQQQCAASKGANHSLPVELQRAELGFSGYLFALEKGWVSTYRAVKWCVLCKNSLFIFDDCQRNPAQVELRHAEVSWMRTPELGPSHELEWAFTLRHGAAKHALQLGCFTEEEREMWVALLQASILQANPSRDCTPRERMHLKAVLIETPGLPSPPTPCPDDQKPEMMESCVSLGTLLIELEKDVPWTNPTPWQRRTVTVHDTWCSMRTKPANVQGFSMRHCKLAMAPRPDHPWIFAIIQPFHGRVQGWCEDVHTFTKWYTKLDSVIRRANPHLMRSISKSLMPTYISSLELCKKMKHAQETTLVVPFTLTIPATAEGVATLPSTSAKSWRVLTTPDGVVGTYEPEGVWTVVEAEGGLKWASAEGKAPGAGAPPPRHSPSKAMGVVEAMAKFRQCVEGECRAEVLAPLQPQPERVGVYVATKGMERNLHSFDHPVWVVQGHGSSRLVLFHPECAALRGPEWADSTAVGYRRSWHHDRIPDDWATPGKALSHLGGAEICLKAGDALYLPADVFFGLRSQMEWNLVLFGHCPKPKQ